MRTMCYAALLLCLLTAAAKPSQAAVVFGIDPDPITFVEGTPQVSFDLVLTNTGDPGVLSSFSYAVSVERISGTGSVALLGTPVLLSAVDTWTSVEAGSTDTIYAANVNPPGGSSLSADFPAQVVRFNLDTSGALAGDTYSINPNFNNFAAATDSGDPYVISSQTGTLTAVPEPSSVAVLGGLVAVGACRWRRKQKAATAAVPC